MNLIAKTVSKAYLNLRIKMHRLIVPVNWNVCFPPIEKLWTYPLVMSNQFNIWEYKYDQRMDKCVKAAVADCSYIDNNN